MVDDVAIVELVGQFVSSEEAFKNRLLWLADEGHLRVVIDLANVSYMDSSGLGELIAGYVAAKHAGGALKLLRVPKRVQALLTVTHLATIFETFSEEAAAVASFVDSASPPARSPERTTA
jgi:anti-sigma B factor antagonist